jgi:protein tyrosine/serine phosphatase
MEVKKKQVLAQQIEELETFRNEAREKLSKQNHVLDKLLNKKAGVERESKEALYQLEQETTILIAQAKQKIDSESLEQQRLVQENGILTRRLASTQSTIASLRETVAKMLDQTAKTQAIVSRYCLLHCKYNVLIMMFI